MPLTLRIRPESAGDFTAIYRLVEAAFKTARHASGDEQDYVLRLRASAIYIPELALVAEDAGELIGHIMLTRLSIDTVEGGRPALLLSPLAVTLPRRRQGVGAALVREALACAKASGHASVFVVGDPAYYSRFGFRSSREFGIVNCDGFADRNVMACELTAGALKTLIGSVSFPT